MSLLKRLPSTTEKAVFESETLNSERFDIPAKAPLPIDVTESAIVMLYAYLQSENAKSPMPVMPSSMIILFTLHGKSAHGAPLPVVVPSPAVSSLLWLRT